MLQAATANKPQWVWRASASHWTMLCSSCTVDHTTAEPLDTSTRHAKQVRPPTNAGTCKMPGPPRDNGGAHAKSPPAAQVRRRAAPGLHGTATWCVDPAFLGDLVFLRDFANDAQCTKLHMNAKVTMGDDGHTLGGGHRHHQQVTARHHRCWQVTAMLAPVLVGGLNHSSIPVQLKHDSC